MRRRARVDANQPAIVKALRGAGCSVLHLHELGHGRPDICVGLRGINYLFEIKDPTKPKNQRELTDDEKAIHYTWRGQINVIESAEDALAFMDIL